MDINTQNSSGMMNGMPPTPHNEKKVGPIVGALIIVLVLIIAALYFFGQKLNTDYKTESATQQQSNANTVNDSVVATVSNAPVVDDVTSLQSDLDIQMKDVDYSF